MTSPSVPQRRPAVRQTLPFPAAWLPHLGGLPFYRRLDGRGQERLRHDLHVFVREKHWHGHGIVVTDEIQVVIAAQAALLLLNIEHDYYPNVHTIVVHPTRFRDADTDAPLRRRQGPLTLGAVSTDGVVALAWDAVRFGAIDPRDGRNLVFHEFAHELDLLDGAADGEPPLSDARLHAEWGRAFHAQLLHLRAQVAQGHATLLDRYGAQSRAELFAVATECFFERSAELARQHPDLYLLLWRYYGQDPAAR